MVAGVEHLEENWEGWFEVERGKTMRRFTSLAFVLVLAAFGGCSSSSDQEPVAVVSPDEVFDFGVHWPPQDPEAPEGPVGDPLLLGQLQVRKADLPDSAVGLAFAVELTRPDDEQARESWNSRLAYREYDWMRRLRIRDAEERWIWPNLPYLLRAHGTARFERYGGVDPGSGLDNDFAGVLVRAYDVAGTEWAVTRDDPLVSAEWHAVGVKHADRTTIVHRARSDEFTLPLESNGSSGRFGIWLIYADFMGAPVPASWPKEAEWKGGILAYFDMEWETDSHGECRFDIEQRTPPGSSGFDWEAWLAADEPKAKRAPARLAIR